MLNWIEKSKSRFAEMIRNAREDYKREKAENTNRIKSA